MTFLLRDGSELTIPYELIRSKRRTFCINLSPDGSVTVRVPLYASNSGVLLFLQEKQEWLLERYLKIRENRMASPLRALSEEEKTALQKKYRRAASAHFPERVEYYRQFTGGNYTRICIRDQKTRWGSCSSKGTLSFNWRLMLAPPEVLDYVVVHELCHLTCMNHSPAFWKRVESVLPDYAARRKWLKDHGEALMQQ